MIKSLKLKPGPPLPSTLQPTKRKVNDMESALTTPQPFYDAVHASFKFTLDAAANQYNTKCCVRFLTGRARTAPRTAGCGSTHRIVLAT